MISTRVPTPPASTETARSQAALGENALRRFVIDHHGSFDSAGNERIFEKWFKTAPRHVFQRGRPQNTVSPGSGFAILGVATG